MPQAATLARRISTAAGIGIFALALSFPAAVGAQDDLNCEDFATQAEAQATLEADRTDPNNLDGDGDGKACDEGVGGLPTTSSDSSGSTAASSDSSGSTAALASTGFEAWALVVVGVAGIGGAIALRQRARTLS